MRVIRSIIENKTKNRFWDQLFSESEIFPVILSVFQREVPKVGKHQIIRIEQKSLLLRVSDFNTKNEITSKKYCLQRQINNILQKTAISDIRFV